MTSVLKMLNANGVAYQLVNKPEFGKTYIKVSVLSEDLLKCMQSILSMTYEMDDRYFVMGDGVYLTFESLVPDLDADKTFPQRFVEEYADYIESANCIAGNVDVLMRELPDGISKYLNHCKKVVAKDYIQYTLKKNGKTLIVSVRK